MHNDLVELGWTDSQWNRIVNTVSEEAQKGRVAAQMLPMVGPEDATTVAVPSYGLIVEDHEPKRRLAVDSDPTLFLTNIWVNVYLHTREAADPQLSAALTMFRRAANYIARIEDALIFHGRVRDTAPPHGLTGIPAVYSVTGHGVVLGLLRAGSEKVDLNEVLGQTAGDRVVTGIIEAINRLDARGQLGPYACALSPALFQAVCTPGSNLVLPRDRILPFLQGPLVRASALADAGDQQAWGLVVALSGNPIEIVVASDICVRYLQTSEEPRVVFRVSERVALRIKERDAIQPISLADEQLKALRAAP